MSTLNSTSKHGADSEDEYGLDIKHRKSFPVTCDNSSSGSYKNRNEDFGSTSSESTSAGSSVIPMSTSDSPLRGESMVHQINPAVPLNQASYPYQMPQRYVQPVAVQFQQTNVPHVPMGIPVGYPQVQGHPTLTNIKPSQPLQPPTIVYPMQQYHAKTQDWARMPTSTTAYPFMMQPVSYPTQNITEPHQVSSVASSAVSTPVFSFSSPGYINTYGYVSTPVLSSASCTPVPYQTYVEVPPTLNLHKNNVKGYNVPQGMSCNINMCPVSDGCRSAPEKPAAQSAISSNLPTNQPEGLKMGTTTGGVGEAAPEQGDEEDDLWQGNVNYDEYQENGSSNLFVTWFGTKGELVEKIQSHNLQVRDIFTTVEDTVYNVIFVSHPIARKAFTMQQQIGLRIIPPKNSHRIWLRNPSPNFMVKFETKCCLVVRKGKAECHDVVGELLEGCLISADQLKGHRIRVVSCEGSFKFPGGKIVEMKGLPNNADERTSLGWISYRCKYTKESLVIRKSWNKLGDYVYNGK